ncbi:MAG: hypothetical protein DWQ44_04895 [Bacteroidetes bacterium]|nr:MAG: hypothetical protein DWQ33_10895 [Bacteroidota bacterium]REK00597.1 MAG: hypothetical protein DWQ39_10570 [Bacteroidota bacterium]REK35281.1 MAG: hypothetical protein DWQ44_04895 [Bacteroidota bacterium]REK48357.1 MAG: hypothetical protein DWQ48_11095 [Bacteroidota bacterium]
MPGYNYYRLKQVDYNGVVEYYMLEYAIHLKKVQGVAVLYPNPLARGRNISIQLSHQSTSLRLLIHDHSEKVLIESIPQSNVSSNIYALQTDHSQLPKGFYHYTLMEERSIISNGKLSVSGN